jgi:hypothetical protein
MSAFHHVFGLLLSPHWLIDNHVLLAASVCGRRCLFCVIPDARVNLFAVRSAASFFTNSHLQVPAADTVIRYSFLHHFPPLLTIAVCSVHRVQKLIIVLRIDSVWNFPNSLQFAML